MGSVSSEDDFDQLSERFESYSLSADVSESESSSGFFSLTSSPLAGNEVDENSDIPAPVPVMLPVVGGRHVVIPAKKTDNSETELSGKCLTILFLFFY
jgi:hypothetical protein